ncbi:hypothetical protein Afil01_60680 [Actinorhabdospora filicis]|uniref:Uncharacterized protein n=1 Tax=Actinorhabdospora filicis TaxID=1785913 RepID=A0A9W6WD50_9ACTN|nr:hypothetical protein [Actinorhabdospora filicis]GLZ81261.1 hypothetical protein Afil01_60680 [Actinorhabdospora filicis]
MSDFIPPEDYIHLFGAAKAPGWFPGLQPGFVRLGEKLDATRDESGYGPASVAHALAREPWDGRQQMVLWALLRALLRQPGSLPMFAPEIVEGCSWGRVDAMWVIQYTPAQPETVHLILAAVESVPPEDRPVLAATVAGLRELTGDPGVHARLDAIEKDIAGRPRPDDVLDPRLLDRIPEMRHLPIMELLSRCAVTKPERLPYWRRDNLRRAADGLHDAIRLLLMAVPGHLAEHGGFSHGEDVLRGLIMLELELPKKDLSPELRQPGLTALLADIIRAVDATRPRRGEKLANAAAEVLYYKKKAKGTVRQLVGEVTGKRLKARLEMVLEYM